MGLSTYVITVNFYCSFLFFRNHPRFKPGVFKGGHGTFTGSHEKNPHFELQFTFGTKLKKLETFQSDDFFWFSLEFRENIEEIREFQSDDLFLVYT